MLLELNMNLRKMKVAVQVHFVGQLFCFSKKFQCPIDKLFITVYTVHIGYEQLGTGGMYEDSAKLRDSDL